MDEFNNDKNPFDEQPSGGQDANPYAQQNNQQQNGNPYAQQGGNPYNQQPQQNANPYNQPNQGYAYNQQNIPQQGYSQPQGYQQQGYAQQGYGAPYMQPYAQQGSTGMATASLVLGIISIVMGIPMLMLPPLFILPIIGLVLGIVFKTKHLPVGKGLSTAGIITSSLGLVLPILLVILFVVLFFTSAEFRTWYLDTLKEVSPDK